MSELTVRVLDLYDRVLAAAADQVPPALAAELARIGRDLRARRLYDGVTLIGLAGGTGSGKSSLLNALAGVEVSEAGSIRPTTSEPIAWVPLGVAGRMASLWMRLGIGVVITHDEGHALTLVDLPDIDSLEEDHQRIVDELLPILDVVVWVIDPEKYGDEILHSRFLVPRATQASRYRFVLNQVDRLTPDEVALVVDDLTQALRSDGITDPVVWPVAADPESGPPIGIEQVWQGITDLAGDDLAQQRLFAELRRGIDLLGPYIGSVGFTQRWDTALRLSSGLMVHSPLEAVRILRELVLQMSIEGVGIDRDLDVASIVGHPEGSPGDVARWIDSTLGRVLRDVLRRRATARALADELMLMLGSTGQ
jgi:energy-coupling factor transporter ATP-binding protein EcfA2